MRCHPPKASQPPHLRPTRLALQAWDELEGKPADAADGAGDGASLDKLLASEVADLKDPKQQRFDILNMNQKALNPSPDTHLLVSQCAPLFRLPPRPRTLGLPLMSVPAADYPRPSFRSPQSLTYLQRKQLDGPNINDLVAAVLRKAEATQESRAKCVSACPFHPSLSQLPNPRRSPSSPPARFCHRILPIETVCYASQEEIVKNILPFIEKLFPTGPDAKPLTARAHTRTRLRIPCPTGFVWSLSLFRPRPQNLSPPHPFAAIGCSGFTAGAEFFQVCCLVPVFSLREARVVPVGFVSGISRSSPSSTARAAATVCPWSACRSSMQSPRPFLRCVFVYFPRFRPQSSSDSDPVDALRVR